MHITIALVNVVFFYIQIPVIQKYKLYSLRRMVQPSRPLHLPPLTRKAYRWRWTEGRCPSERAGLQLTTT